MQKNTRNGIVGVALIGSVFAFLLAIKPEKKKEVVIKQLPLDPTEPTPMYAITTKKVSVFKEITTNNGIKYLTGELISYTSGTHIGLVIEIIGNYIKLKREINGVFYYCFVEKDAVILTTASTEGLLPNTIQSKQFVNNIIA